MNVGRAGFPNTVEHPGLTMIPPLVTEDTLGSLHAAKARGIAHVVLKPGDGQPMPTGCWGG